MYRKCIAITVTAAFLAPLFSGEWAVGSVPSAGSVASLAASASGAASTSSTSSTKKSGREKSSSFARFRPVTNENSRLDHALFTERRTIDQVFDADMTQRLGQKYQEVVAPAEREALNPYRRASPWEMQRYELSRKELAEWTLKEVGKDQLKDFVDRTRKDSSAIGAVASTSGLDEKNSKDKDSSSATGSAAATGSASAYGPRFEQPAATEEEPSIPTRLKAKLNILKTRGQLTFTNPVVTTSIEARAGSGDNLNVEMNREFRKLDMRSKVRYGVDQSVLVLNLNQKITEEVSVDLNSERWTGSKRNEIGRKKRETAKVLYSISF